MTIKIFYEYVRGDDFPFRAMCWIGNASMCGVSRNSYAGAKSDLLRVLRPAAAPEVPEPEEVEIR